MNADVGPFILALTFFFAVSAFAIANERWYSVVYRAASPAHGMITKVRGVRAVDPAAAIRVVRRNERGGIIVVSVTEDERWRD